MKASIISNLATCFALAIALPTTSITKRQASIDVILHSDATIYILPSIPADGIVATESISQIISGDYFTEYCTLQATTPIKLSKVATGTWNIGTPTKITSITCNLAEVIPLREKRAHIATIQFHNEDNTDDYSLTIPLDNTLVFPTEMLQHLAVKIVSSQDLPDFERRSPIAFPTQWQGITDAEGNL